MKFGRSLLGFTTAQCLLLGADSCEKFFEAPAVGIPDTGGGEKDNCGNDYNGIRNDEFRLLDA